MEIYSIILLICNMRCDTVSVVVKTLVKTGRKIFSSRETIFKSRQYIKVNYNSDFKCL